MVCLGHQMLLVFLSARQIVTPNKIEKFLMASSELVPLRQQRGDEKRCHGLYRGDLSG